MLVMGCLTFKMHDIQAAGRAVTVSCMLAQT